MSVANFRYTAPRKSLKNIYLDLFLILGLAQLSKIFLFYNTFNFYYAGYMHMNDLEFQDNFKMISDWEVAERQAFSLCFDLLLLGCLFHLGI